MYIIYNNIQEAGLAMTQMNIRIDETVKAKAEALFDDLGLNMTTAVNMFIKAALRENRIPFALKVDLFIVRVIWKNWNGVQMISIQEMQG